VATYMDSTEVQRHHVRYQVTYSIGLDNIDNMATKRRRLCHSDLFISQLINRHTHTHPFNRPLSGTTEVSRYQKVKPTWILLKQETVSGNGINWAIFKSAPRSRQKTTPVPNHSVFLQAGCPSCRPTNSVKALKATQLIDRAERKFFTQIQLSQHCLNSHLPSSHLPYSRY